MKQERFREWYQQMDPLRFSEQCVQSSRIIRCDVAHMVQDGRDLLS